MSRPALHLPDGRPIFGVVFDMDGTLVDSRLDFAAIRRDMGLPPDRSILDGLPRLLPQARREAEAILHEHERRGGERATLLPGAGRLLDRLTTLDLPHAVLSRNSREVVALTLDRLEVACTVRLGRDDAAAKPAPDGLLSICTRWSLLPQHVLMVGDYKYDLLAARACGCPSALVTWSREWPFAALADTVAGDLDELSARLGER